MEKLYFLSHATRYLATDAFLCGTHVFRPACSHCDGNLNGLVEPLKYEWEFGFENPQASVNAGHHCYWCDVLMMVNGEGRSILEGLDLPLRFLRAELDKGKVPSGLKPSSELYWTAVECVADADAEASGNETCPECGEFVKKRRQTSRLRISKSSIPDAGVFTVRQNGADGPIFVTERVKEVLQAGPLKGVGFYSAGNRMI